MKKIPIIILCLMFALGVSAQDYTLRYRYRVTLKDKKGTPFTTSRPEQFLSAKAIERRKKQKLKIDKTDLPVSPVYLTAIRQDGVKVIICSRWNNTVLVETTDGSIKNYNTSSIGICYEGGHSCSPDVKYEDNRTAEQMVALDEVLRILHEIYPEARIVGHCELNPRKACPCLDPPASEEYQYIFN